MAAIDPDRTKICVISPGDRRIGVDQPVDAVVWTSSPSRRGQRSASPAILSSMVSPSLQGRHVSAPADGWVLAVPRKSEFRDRGTLRDAESGTGHHDTVRRPTHSLPVSMKPTPEEPWPDVQAEVFGSPPRPRCCSQQRLWPASRNRIIQPGRQDRGAGSARAYPGCAAADRCRETACGGSSRCH